MAIRRALAVMVMLAFSASVAVAQQAAKKDDRKRSREERQEIEQVVKIVDGVMAGQQAPAEVTMKLEPFLMNIGRASWMEIVYT